jgi:hypothetical protein
MGILYLCLVPFVASFDFGLALGLKIDTFMGQLKKKNALNLMK